MLSLQGASHTPKTIAQIARLADESRRLLAAMLFSRTPRMVPQSELAGNAAIEPLAMQAAVVEPAAASALSMISIIGIAVGSTFLVGSAVLVTLIFHKRASHQRAMATMEEGQPTLAAQSQTVQIGDCQRPAVYSRKASLLPISAKAGWGALSSSEEIMAPNLAEHPSSKPKRGSMLLKKKMGKGGIPLKRLKYLSAIIESPRSRSAQSLAPRRVQTSSLSVAGDGAEVGDGSGNVRKRSIADDGDVFASPKSPKPHVLPSFAIRSPGRYGALFTAEDNPKAMRSRSVGAFVAEAAETASLNEAPLRTRPPTHARSISLGAHRMSTLPPTGPVPPLPVIAPHDPKMIDARKGVCVSRLSTSSSGSGGSSVLVTSPLVRGPEITSTNASPSIEQMVADDDMASLKTVSQRQWQNPFLIGPRAAAVAASSSPTLPHSASVTHKASIRSNIARYSTESTLTRDLSTSTASSLDDTASNRLSIPQIVTADRMSISRVSSTNSLKSSFGSTTNSNKNGVVKKVHTPRKVSRCSSTSVSATGSPAERKKGVGGVLRDISGNACALPSRQVSSATQDSARSSNGDPFQWDSKPLLKPSALKGSPNARKGHRRQNCVRISTLTPQILGPPPSRPTSPSLMQRIQESPDENEGLEVHGLPFMSSMKRASCATSRSLRIQTLRASLTPSSPTLSAWNTFQKHGLPSQPSDSEFSDAAPSPAPHLASRRSSAFSIPAFPSPSKTTMAAVQLAQPVPEFHFTRPSTDEPEWSSSPGSSPREEDDCSPPFDLHVDVGTSSSPPSLPVSAEIKDLEYDPAWPSLSVPARTGAQEYDPTSPAIVWETSASGGDEGERSSPFFASTVTLSDADLEISPRSRPMSYATQDYQPDSPPCSPQTMPKGFHAFFAGKTKPSSASSTPRAAVGVAKQEQGEGEDRPSPLTSANASTRLNLDFSTAPVLSPPRDYSPIPYHPPNSTTHPPVPVIPAYSPHRLAPAPPTLSPSGPRPPPSKSVLQTTIALRRMNSEIDTSASRQSRRYIHGLTREPSPLLPWIGSPDPSEDAEAEAEMFDFDFASTEPGAEDTDAAGALDEIDISDLERRLEGALSGFDAPANLDEVAEETEVDRMVTNAKQSEESVREDGGKFWMRTSLSTIPGSTPDTKMTPVGPKSSDKIGLGVENISPIRWGSVNYRNSVGVRERPVSILATPRSLYDADGFLRSEG